MSDFTDAPGPDDVDPGGETGFGGPEPAEPTLDPTSHDPYTIVTEHLDGSTEAVTDDDGDGRADLLQRDADADGLADATYVDTDGDHRLDTLLRDHDDDGVVDQVLTDTDGDGRFDSVQSDRDNDGRMDSAEIDTDLDGRTDTWMRDTDGDGVADQMSQSLLVNPYVAR